MEFRKRKNGDSSLRFQITINNKKIIKLVVDTVEEYGVTASQALSMLLAEQASQHERKNQ